MFCRFGILAVGRKENYPPITQIRHSAFYISSNREPSCLCNRRNLWINNKRMNDSGYELRAPGSAEEWRAFHDLRRKVLFENRGNFETYNESHPDDVKPVNHPLALLHNDEIIGVIRVDVCETVAWFRRVAIREDVQRLGHGRVLLRLAEEFAIEKGCREVRSNVAIDALGFYESCGYVRGELSTDAVSVRKLLH